MHGYAIVYGQDRRVDRGEQGTIRPPLPFNNNGDPTEVNADPPSRLIASLPELVFLYVRSSNSKHAAACVGGFLRRT
eukprot:2944923-Rhodomonas_salina.3